MRQADVWRATALAGTVLAGPLLAAVGCSSGPAGPAGAVTGTFIRVGGPAGTPNVPLPGTVSFQGQHGTVTLSASGTGTFNGRLPVGRYTLTAKSSLINSGDSACSRPLTVQVRDGKTTKITVICDIS